MRQHGDAGPRTRSHDQPVAVRSERQAKWAGGEGARQIRKPDSVGTRFPAHEQPH